MGEAGRAGNDERRQTMRTILLAILSAAALAGAALGLAGPAAADGRGVYYAAPGYDRAQSGVYFHLEARRAPVYYDRRRYYDGYVYHQPRVRPRTVYHYRYPRDTYPPFYYRRDPGAAVAAGIIGLATGAILGQALAVPQPRHAPRVQYHDANAIAYCARKYRSFDPNSFTFLGYDGRRHYCRVP